MKTSFSKDTIRKNLLRDIGKLKDRRGFIEAGYPRFQRLFGRDSLITAWQFLNTNPDITRKTLEILAEFQGTKIDPERDEEPGKILHEHIIGRKRHPDGYFPLPYYGSVDSTSWFLILFSFYFSKTKDEKFLKKHWKNILLALNWSFNFGDRDNDYFLEYKRKRRPGLFHQGWKDGFKNHLHITPPVAIVEVQGYQYLALIEIAKLAKILGDEILAKSLLKRAEKLKKNFNKKFWMKDKRYFALGLDGKKRQRKAVTSSPGHLLFTGICDKEKEKTIVKRLFEKDLWTSYGIRTHSSLEPDFDPRSYHSGSVWPHDNWIIAQGLKKLGYKREYLKIKNALLMAYKKLGFIPEFYGVGQDGKIIINGLQAEPCPIQAWAIGGLLNFLSSQGDFR